MDGTPIIIKKKKAHGHAHHGGSWKVAYADFVTAMMAFFMVMWILGLSDDARAQISGYFNDPLGYSKTQPMSQNIISLKGMEAPRPGKSKAPGSAEQKKDQEKIRDLKGKIEKAVTGDIKLKDLLEHFDVIITPEGLRIEMVESAGSVFFETGSANIKPAARQLIGKIAPILKEAGRPMVVEGHTDSRPYKGSGYTNWFLSTDRAKSLFSALRANGIQEKQFAGIRGLADTELKFRNDPYNFANRRVSLLIPFEKQVVQKDVPDKLLDKPIDGAFRREFSIAPEQPVIRPSEE